MVARRFVAVLPSLIVSVVVVACSGAPSSSGPPTRTSSRPPNPLLGETPVPYDLIEIPLQGSLPRSAIFAGLTFTLMAAEVTNLPPESANLLGLQPVPGPDLFAKLDVAVHNPEAEDRTLPTEGFFTLQTYTAQRIPQIESSFLPTFSRIPPGQARQDTVAFRVSDQQILDGALLLIGTEADVPATISLTGPPREPDYPRALPQAGEATGTDAVSAPVRWSLTRVLLSWDQPAGTCCPESGVRADTGALYLTVYLVGTAQPSPYGTAYLTGRSLVVVADGVEIRAFGGTDKPTVPVGESASVEGYFLIPDDASTLMLRVGEVNGTLGEIPIDLVSAS